MQAWNTHRWAFFFTHPELAFIQTDWLEQHHQMRIWIVNRRLEDAAANNFYLSNEEQGNNEPTLFNKDNNGEI